MGEFIGVFFAFLDVQTALVALVYGVILWRKIKGWGLLVYGLNVILPWFVLHLLL